MLTIKNMYDVERKKKCLDLFRPFSSGEKTDEIEITTGMDRIYSTVS